MMMKSVGLSDNKTAFILASILIATTALAAAGEAQAQQENKNATEEQLRACSRITDTNEKMACFDTVVKTLEQEPEVPVSVPVAAPVVAPVAAASEVEKAVEPDFPDPVAAKQTKKKKIEPGDADAIYATIVEAWPTIDNRFEVRLDNGQVWRETELTRTNRLPKIGNTVRITEGRWGSYRMKINDNKRLAAVRQTK